MLSLVISFLKLIGVDPYMFCNFISILVVPFSVDVIVLELF